jgi:hypothetical protein
MKEVQFYFHSTEKSVAVYLGHGQYRILKKVESWPVVRTERKNS